MQPELCFFKDFDSFNVEPEYLEIVYDTKPFRFAYPTNGQNRKFSVKTIPKIQVTLPEMILQSEDTNHLWSGSHVVDFSAQFEDLGILGDFVAKLKTVAGYEQLKISTCKTAKKSKDDSFSEDDIDENDLDTNIASPPARLCFYNEYTTMNVTAQHFDITSQGVVYRFLHPQLDQRRFATSGIQYAAKVPRQWAHFLVKGSILQKQDPNTGLWTDGHKVDFYMVLEHGDIMGDLSSALKLRRYIEA